MKKIFSLLTALALVFALGAFLPEGAMLLSASALTYEDTNGTWTYIVQQDGTISLTGFTKNDYFNGTVVIPEKINYTTVTKIAFKFADDEALKTELKKVSMPDTITDGVADKLFEGCSKLVQVRLSKNLTTISSYMFYDCSSLTTIENFSDNENITSIGAMAFFYNNAMKSIVLPPNVSELSNAVFFYCVNLESVTLPENLTKIAQQAFAGCDKLKYLFIPKSVTEIDDKGLLISSLKGTYIPNVIGYSGTAAETYSTEHGISFTAIDSLISKIKYDMSITDGKLGKINLATLNRDWAVSFTDVPGSNLIMIQADENAAPAGKQLDHWKITTSYVTTKTSPGGYTYNSYPSPFTTTATESFRAYDAALTESVLYNDIMFAVKNPDYTVTFKGTVVVEPVYEYTPFTIVDSSLDVALSSDGTSTINDSAPDTDGIAQLTAYIDYYKKQNYAAYTVSGNVWTVDFYNDGTDDFTIDTAANKITLLDTSTMPKTAGFYAGDEQIAYMKTYLQDTTTRTLHNRLCFTAASQVEAQDLGTQTIDLSGGEYILTEGTDDAFMTAINMFMNDGTIDFNESLELDFNKDGVYDVLLVFLNDDRIKMIRISDKIGVYSIKLSTAQQQQLKEHCEKNKIEVYYNTFRLVFSGSALTPGDADGSGYVDLLDVMLMQQYIAKWNVDINTTAADVDGDGEVTIVDVMLVQQQIAGWSLL